MAAYIRYTGEFTDVQNATQYKITVWDALFSGTTLTFQTNGFLLTYEGDDKELWGLKPSHVKFGMHIATAALTTLVDDIAGAHEQRFLIRIDRRQRTIGDTETYGLFWAGVLVHDITNISDTDTVFITFSAHDGLTRMKDLTWHDSLVGTLNNGIKPLYTVFFTCLQDIPTAYNAVISDYAIWSLIDVWLNHTANWYSDQMYDTTTYDLLDVVQVYSRTFMKNESGTINDSLTCYDILELLCKVFCLRLALVDGAWSLHQVTSYTAESPQITQYSLSGWLGTSNAPGDATLLGGNYNRLANGNFGWINPVRVVKINEIIRQSANLDENGSSFDMVDFTLSTYTIGALGAGTYKEIGVLTADNLFLSYFALIKYEFDNTTGSAMTPGTSYIVARFSFKLVGDGGTTYYLKHPALFDSVGSAVWDTTEGMAYFKSDWFYNLYDSSGIFTIPSPQFNDSQLTPDTGTLYVKIECTLCELDSNGGYTATPATLGSNTFTKTLDFFNVVPFNSDNQIQGATKKYEARNTVAAFSSQLLDSQVIDLGDSVIGSETNLYVGKLLIVDDVDPIYTTVWDNSEWNYSSIADVDILDLTTQAICELYKLPKLTYDGQIITSKAGSADPGETTPLLFDDRVKYEDGTADYFMIFCNGEFDAVNNIWSCRLAAVSSFDLQGIVPATPVYIRPRKPIGFQGTSLPTFSPRPKPELNFSPLISYAPGDFHVVDDGSGRQLRQVITAGDGAYVAAESREAIERFVLLKIGDIPGGNYSEFEADGTYKATGDATTFDDMPMVPVLSLKIPATNAPRLATLSGNLQRYIFTEADYVEGDQEIYNTYQEDSEIEVFVRWANNGSDASDPKYVKFELEVDDANVGGAFTGSRTINTGDIEIAALQTDRTHFLTKFSTTLGGSGTDIQSYIAFLLKRVAASGDAPANDPFILSIGFRVKQDTLGSRTLTAK